jgi:hypothetical protein
MGKPSKDEFQAFDSLMGKLLTVPSLRSTNVTTRTDSVTR